MKNLMNEITTKIFKKLRKRDTTRITDSSGQDSTQQTPGS